MSLRRIRIDDICHFREPRFISHTIEHRTSQCSGSRLTVSTNCRFQRSCFNGNLWRCLLQLYVSMSPLIACGTMCRLVGLHQYQVDTTYYTGRGTQHGNNDSASCVPTDAPYRTIDSRFNLCTDISVTSSRCGASSRVPWAGGASTGPSASWWTECSRSAQWQSSRPLPAPHRRRSPEGP